MHRRAAVVVEEVEDHVADRDLLHPAADVRLSHQPDPALEELEAGPAVLVDRDHLAVDDQFARADGDAHLTQLGVAEGDVLEAAALKAHAAPRTEGDGSNAIPLELEPIALLISGDPL